jgi:hypothetical protein
MECGEPDEMIFASLARSSFVLFCTRFVIIASIPFPCVCFPHAKTKAHVSNDKGMDHVRQLLQIRSVTCDETKTESTDNAESEKMK